MTKIKVYELAKELGKSSKEMLELLAAKNITVKSHMSSLTEEEVASIRKGASVKP
ncbi:MAG: translation initiation factor IF-2 N-terminal domain-containing protein, partial [Eubacteriales bacterium]|nr:translation initiation factor IF-2 N-terminal domain-containing protein [Eubacteriales bacterium]